MLCNIKKELETVLYLVCVFAEVGWSFDRRTGREVEGKRWRSTELLRTKSSNFMIFPNTTWKNASNVCLNLSARLLLAYDDDVIKQEILPRMKIRDFIWVSVKDYGLDCKNKTGEDSNSTETVTVCDSFVRVKMKSTMEKLHYGLCEIGGGIHKQFSGTPYTWHDMNEHCTQFGGQLYKFSTVEEGQSSLSLIRPNQLFWTKQLENKDFPDFNGTTEVLPVCIGLVKLSADSYIYMADNCDSNHSFVCDNSHTEFAPAIEALAEAAPFYEAKEVEKAILLDKIKPTTTTGSTHVPEVSELSESEEPINVGVIVGPVVAGVVIIIVAGIGLYCYTRARKVKAYRKSLLRYQTKKSNFITPRLTCQEITHLDLPDQDNPTYNGEPARQEPREEHDDVYYERRYEPLQRELVDACTKKLKTKKGVLNEEQLNQMMNYDPLRKDSFQTSINSTRSSCSEGLRYEKYDPDSDEIENQRRLNFRTLTQKISKQNQNQVSSYLKKVKTLDDLDQYENSSSLQEKRVELVKDNCKLQKDSENEIKTLDDLDQYENSGSLPEKRVELVEDNCKLQKDSDNEIKKLEDLDQYENYKLPPLPALPTKTRPKKNGKSKTGVSRNIPQDQDCYENHEI